MWAVTGRDPARFGSQGVRAARRVSGAGARRGLPIESQVADKGIRRFRTTCRSAVKPGTRPSPLSALVRRRSIRNLDRQLPPDRGPRKNEQICITPIRRVGAEGEQLGIVPTSQALDRAREAGLALVEVAGDERPPVCKML